MKSILLASTGLVALAGTASAEITWSGSATLGFNDTDHLAYIGVPTPTSDNHFGFYWDANIAVTLSQTLDNGLTAGATFDFDVADDNTGTALASGSYVVFITSDMGSLYYGDTSFAAEKHWASAGDMEADAFSAADGEVVLRGDMMYGPVEASVSYTIADAGGTLVKGSTNPVLTQAVDQLSLGATATFGAVVVKLAYQEQSDGGDANAADQANRYDPEDANGDFVLAQVWGISAGGSFGGADITVAYAERSAYAGPGTATIGKDSLGVKVSYPIGPVTATAYYVSEGDDTAVDPADNWGVNLAYASGPFAATLDYQNDQGTTKVGLEGSYDVGNGVMVYAGYLTNDAGAAADWDDAYYIAGTLDLGSGASLLMSFADGGRDSDEYGANEYQQGTTVEVSFEF
jgi:hypothetical protein